MRLAKTLLILCGRPFQRRQPQWKLIEDGVWQIQHAGAQAQVRSTQNGWRMQYIERHGAAPIICGPYPTIEAAQSDAFDCICPF